jgi:primosomal protein N'
MRRETRIDASIFSRRCGGIEHVLQRGEQAIRSLNRRGTSTYVFCRDCGEALMLAMRCRLHTMRRWGVQLQRPGGRRSHPVCHHCNNRRATGEVRTVAARASATSGPTEKLEEAVRRVPHRAPCAGITM